MAFGDYGIDLSSEPLVSINYIEFNETGILSKKLRISEQIPSPLLSINIALKYLKDYIDKLPFLDSKDSERLYQAILRDLDKIKSLVRKLQMITECISIIKMKKEKLKQLGFASIYSFLREALDAIKDNRWSSFINMVEEKLEIKIPEVTKPRIMIYGKDIGSIVAYMLQKAKKRILIFTQNFHDFKISGTNTRVLNLLKEKANEGVYVGVICRHPENVPPTGRETFLKTLKDIQNFGEITCFLCWHMHMKIILVDDIVIVGSANFTESGMHGIGEVAFIIDDKRYSDEVANLFSQIQRREHYICKQFCNREKCGHLHEIML